MNVKGLVVGVAVISLIVLGGCASKAGANQENPSATTLPATTTPPTTTLAPISSISTAWPVLATYKDCANCHGSVPDKAPPITHYKVDGD